jgi:hypothetical protein
MKNTRSSLLKPMPARISSRRLKSMSRRIGLILLLTAIIGTPIFIIATRILPREGAGNVFYWFHDHIFLPVKGYTYTLFYPFSLSWWGPILTVALVWVLAYLAMVSITRDPHAQVLRLVVRRNSRHRFLIKTTQWLRKWKMEALLLKEIAGQERLKALNRIRSLPLKEVDEEVCNRFFHLTILDIRLRTLSPASPHEHLETALAWHQAYLQFRNRLQRQPGSESLKLMTARLADLAGPLLLPLLDYTDAARMEEAEETPAGFDVATIGLDLLYLAAVHNREPGKLIAALSGEKSKTEIEEIAASRLAQSVASRQNIIIESRMQAELIRTGEIDTRVFVEKESKKEWPLLLDDRIEMTVIGRLALSVTLDLAGLVKSAAIALDFMEALETLDFELNCLDPEAWDAGLVHPLKELPESPDFRWCAELAEAELEAYEKAWRLFPQEKENPINEDDFHLARTRIRALYHAAGPEFDKK